MSETHIGREDTIAPCQNGNGFEDFSLPTANEWKYCTHSIGDWEKKISLKVKIDYLTFGCNIFIVNVEKSKSYIMEVES